MRLPVRGTHLWDAPDARPPAEKIEAHGPQLALFGRLDCERRRRGTGDPHCLDCGVDTLASDYYMLYSDVWLQANPDDAGMLCIACVEHRLGRALASWDFTSAPINLRPATWKRIAGRSAS